MLLQKKFLIQCMECGDTDTYQFNKKCRCCNSNWFTAVYDLQGNATNNLKTLIQSDVNSMWRYVDLLSLQKSSNIVSLNEGWTPIFRLTSLENMLGISKIFVKDERKNPTGTFKDRQASLAISTFKENQIHQLVACSTGNVGVSYAAYCADANITFSVFLPEGVNESKICKIEKYGATVHRVSGNYDEAKRVAKQYANENKIYYDAGTVELHNRESKKTIAYEIAEQFSWEPPDWYVQAVSGGSGPLGVWMGFNELKAIGIINKIPKIACVQVSGCSPMVDSFHINLKNANPVTPSTNILALSTGNPGISYTFLFNCLSKTGGTMVKVNEDRAKRISKFLSDKENLFMCSAASVAFEGLCHLRQNKIISKEATVIVNCSGR